jgi:hypothetical protein
LLLFWRIGCSTWNSISQPIGFHHLKASWAKQGFPMVALCECKRYKEASDINSYVWL